MEILLSLSLSLLVGLMLSRVAKLLQLPAVTAYLVAGILVGPFVLGAFGVKGLGFTSEEDIQAVSIISEVALGLSHSPSGTNSAFLNSKKLVNKRRLSAFCKR